MTAIGSAAKRRDGRANSAYIRSTNFISLSPTLRSPGISTASLDSTSRRRRSDRHEDPGNPHVWVTVGEGPRKKLGHLSFGAFEDDFDRFADACKRWA